MKKKFLAFVSVILCLSMLAATGVYAEKAQPSYDSVEEYVEEAEAETDDNLELKIKLSKVLNKVSNFFINSFLGTVLNIIIPDSAAVADYEKFNIDEYEGFYKGMDTFIDEPQGDKVWNLGYGKASILPKDFGEKKYAKGAYLPYVFGTEIPGMY